jgi:galactonate dehydratase
LFVIHEAYDDDLWGKIIRPHWKKDGLGNVSLPEGVGLCLDVDEQTLAQVAADPAYKYEWRGPRFYPDGSVADY